MSIEVSKKEEDPKKGKKNLFSCGIQKSNIQREREREIFDFFFGLIVVVFSDSTFQKK